MKLALEPYIRVAPIGDDLVLLDIAADAYFALPDGAREVAFEDHGRALVAPEAMGREWLEAGLARNAAADGARPPPPLPSNGLDLSRPAGFRNGDILALAGALADVACDYRGRSFQEILRRARRTRGSIVGGSPDDVLRLSAVFAGAAVWLPLPGKCLARSFALLRFLQRRGCDADWVFGVRTWPFAAHCWLQAGECALDDTPEQLAAYTPILVV